MLRNPNKIRLSSKALLTQPSDRKSESRSMEIGPSSNSRPFSSASNVQAYLANLQRKVRNVDQPDSPDSANSVLPSSVDDAKTVVEKESYNFTSDSHSTSSSVDSQLERNRIISSKGNHKDQTRAERNEDESVNESSSDSLSDIFNVKSLSEIDVLSPREELEKPIETEHQLEHVTNLTFHSSSSESVETEHEGTTTSVHSIEICTDNTSTPAKSTADPVTELDVAPSLTSNESHTQSTIREAHHIDEETQADDQEAKENTSDDETSYEPDFEDPDEEDEDEESNASTTAVHRANSPDSSTSSIAYQLQQGQAKPQSKLQNTAVQIQSVMTKAVQTDIYPPTIVSVAEYFHYDRMPSTSAATANPVYDAHIALANCRTGLHPQSIQNRLIYSVLEAHLHCIRVFAEGQRAIYDQWTELFGSQLEIISKRKKKVKKKK